MPESSFVLFSESPNLALENQGVVLYVPIDGPSIVRRGSSIDQTSTVLGQVSFTRFPDDSVGPSRFKVQIDSAEPWYTLSDPGSLVEGTTIDLQSVVTHEFGHVTSLDHLDVGLIPCSRPLIAPTMCSVIRLLGGSDRATFRTLQLDDTSTDDCDRLVHEFD